MTRRLFLAVLPPADVVAALDEQVARARRANADERRLRWTDPAQWHVTLLFCPDVDDEQLAALQPAAATVTSRVAPFELAVHGGGAFDGLACARHLVACLADEQDALPRLAGGLRTAAGRSGAEHADQPFRAHLTLARLTRPTDRSADAGWLDALRTPAWPVTEVGLLESHLVTGQRARHEVLARLPLGAGVAGVGHP